MWKSGREQSKNGRIKNNNPLTRFYILCKRILFVPSIYLQTAGTDKTKTHSRHQKKKPPIKRRPYSQYKNL